MTSPSTLPIIFLDVDGTLRTGKDSPFCNQPSDVHILDGAQKALETVRRQLGPCHVVWVSNQGGVAAGFTSHQEVVATMQRTVSLFLGEAVAPPFAEPEQCDLMNASATGVWMEHGRSYRREPVLWDRFVQGAAQVRCLKTTDPDTAPSKIFWYESLKSDYFRKPRPGLLHLAMYEIRGSLEPRAGDLMIGDRPEDQAAADAAGVPFLSAPTWREVYGRSQ